MAGSATGRRRRSRQTVLRRRSETDRRLCSGRRRLTARSEPEEASGGEAAGAEEVLLEVPLEAHLAVVDFANVEVRFSHSSGPYKLVQPPPTAGSLILFSLTSSGAWMDESGAPGPNNEAFEGFSNDR